jgi:hypothetical protein
MPRSGLVVIEPQFILCGLKAVLDGPSVPFHRHQCFNGRALRAPRAEIGKFIIGDVATYQQTARPSINRSKMSLSMLIRGSPLRAVTTSAHKIQDSPRRSAIEPEIGHMKSDGRLARCTLKGLHGDAIFAVLCGSVTIYARS